MKTFSLFFLSVLALTFIFCSCEKSDRPENQGDSGDTIKVSLIGFVQKGPFLNGTTIAVSELDNELSQTGKTFSSEIMDNKGTFNLNNLVLASKFVELRANGFYFNEVSGQNSQAQLSLSALADITDNNSLNVNVLTQLEKSRVEFLISSGLSFPVAKHQAQQEVLKIFEISKPDIKSSELLDISIAGDDNAILLAISSLLQGNRTVAALSELLANISTDIREDGQLNSQSLGTELIDDALFLNPATIQNNLKEKYRTLGVDVEVPAIGTHLQHFIQNSNFVISQLISYPDTGITGPNLLAPERTRYNVWTENSGTRYLNSMTALAPGQTDISVRITYIDTCDQQPPVCDSCIADCLPCGNGGSCNWGIDPENSGWAYDVITYTPMTLLFSKDFTKDRLDLKFNLVEHGKILLEIFENKSATPTRTKYINW
jgi:hypothetical protein